MRNKQNNDGSQKSSSSLSHQPPIKTKADFIRQQKLRAVKNADSITFKQAIVPLSKKALLPSSGKDKPQLKSTSVTASIIRQQVSTTLPITIHQLQQKTLNQYLKQFMQISTFQSVQKGKQLIDLVKQSPNSKQSIWVVNKLFKLFKSNIPEAVLCSFQFIRELIQIGSQKIIQMVQQALLMPIVQIIQYRSYIPNIERGNTYFLNSFYRYGPDEKTNHLIKIGSTFFKMVHQALYVWGTLYFPQSNFNKMLNKLINSSKITFPSYPNQFKFYSQARIDLFLALLQNKKEKIHKSLQKIKTQNKTQKLTIDQVIQRSQEKITLKQKPENQSRQIQKVQSPINKNKSKKQEIIKKSQNIKDQPSIKSTSSLPSEKIENKKLQKHLSPQIKQNKQDKIKKYKQEDEEIQCISFAKKSAPQKQIKERQQEVKVLQEYKKSKPIKVKQKKLSIILSQKQITSQNNIQLSHLENIEDPLNLLEIQEKKQIIQIDQEQKKQINEQQTIEVEQIKDIIKKQINILKQSIPKQSLRLDLKKINNKNKSTLSPKTQVQKQMNRIPINNQQHTFRPIQSSRKNLQQKNISQNPSLQQTENVQFQSSQRQRFNYSMTDQSQDRIKNTLIKQKSNPNTDPIPQTNLVTEFLKKQFENLKNTLLIQIKKDIISTLQSRQKDQHVKFMPQNQQKQQENLTHHVKFQKLIDNLSKNQNHQETDPFSGRFGVKSDQQIKPSIEAMEFVKRKLSTGKKLRTVSKRKRHSIVHDLQLDQKENQQNQNQNHKIKKLIQNEKQKETISVVNGIKNIKKQKLVDSGVNTDQFTNQKLYEQLSALKQKLNLVTGSKQNEIKNQLLSNKRQNVFFTSKLHTSSLVKTPNTINKNQEENQKSSQYSSLRSTCNSLRKRSNSKLSERRSSVESLIMQKVLQRPQNCHNQLKEIFGGPNTLLFNAALNSVKKKRPSVMFC